jgi:hypothetical protein
MPLTDGVADAAAQSGWRQIELKFGMLGMRHQPACAASMMRPCWRGVTA